MKRAMALAGWCFLVTAVFVRASSVSYAQENTFPNSGNVGIGMGIAPETPLDVRGITGSYAFRVRNTYSTPVAHIWPCGDGGGCFSLHDSSGALSQAEIRGDGRNSYVGSGNVGIGTSTPETKLDVQGSTGSYVLRVRNTAGNGIAHIWPCGVGEGCLDLYDSAGTAQVVQIRADGGDSFFNGGNVGIGTASPTSRLHVSGNVKVDGSVTGTNIAAQYQDLAEWVPTRASLDPGTVVVIDSGTHNGVLPASQPYDSRVAGVVSARPGIILGERGEGRAKVADSGRVKVKADAQYGAITVGDILVSSATEGYAMRSTPVAVTGVSMHRPGTILEKALEPLAEEKGEILVLLTLQ